MNHSTEATSPLDRQRELEKSPSGPNDKPLTANDFMQLYDEHAAMLLRVVGRTAVPRGNVEDVCQDVWTTVYQKLQSHFDGQNFRAWICEMARNRATDWLRRRDNRNQAMPTDWEAADSRGQGALAERERSERHAALTDCVESLEEPRRTIVRDRLTGAEIMDTAQRLELERAKIDRHFHSAKAQLRTCMDTKGFGEGAL